ncbi:hypothetical protein [Pararhizobium sp.]|uniref:hypothetical protein n=1 Tax=Pararhizobium sp. TaxID=1977563 RepID=UPI0027234742|nr:hypothetical protein [Pararhizobium sp.]MDO9415567.1 hypothetical protein [Pararhizobium sp.]
MMERPPSPALPVWLAVAERAAYGFVPFRLPLPRRERFRPSPASAPDAPDTGGFSPLPESSKCLSTAPRKTHQAAAGAFSIFVGKTLPALAAFNKFFLEAPHQPDFETPGISFRQNQLHHPSFWL